MVSQNLLAGFMAGAGPLDNQKVRGGDSTSTGTCTTNGA